MEAIRQFVKVKNNQINITLLEHFNAEEVEVIILAKVESIFQLTEDQLDILEYRLKEPESEYISSEESLRKIKEKHGF